jgi:hypothetical protein
MFPRYVIKRKKYEKNIDNIECEHKKIKIQCGDIVTTYFWGVDPEWKAKDRWCLGVVIAELTNNEFLVHTSKRSSNGQFLACIVHFDMLALGMFVSI